LEKIEERIEKKLSSWKITLEIINLVLTSLPMFMLSFFKVSRGVLEK
jgi:hypothetical protein